jgi:DNA polymerase V
MTIPLPEQTADTKVLTRAAMMGLDRIYKPGYAYARAGICLAEILPEELCPTDLFISKRNEPERNASLMSTLDAINQRFGGRRSVGLGVAGLTKANRGWMMKREHMTAHYTTRWTDLPIVWAR